jgi:arylsulfatase A
MTSVRIVGGFWTVLAAPVVTVATAADSPIIGSPPNVLLIITDDQGWGDIASHGNPFLKTPHLDRLAEAGARFERFFVSPVCAPTRASLLTGRYHPRTGVHGVTRGMENMRAEEVTVAEAFRAAGYATGCFGKWHNGKHYPMNPLGQGFDEFTGFCGGHWNNYFESALERNGEPFRAEGYITDALTNYALEFIERNRERPFFCYVPCNAPHSPWQVPDEYWEKYGGMGLDEETRCAYAMVQNIDDNVGRMLAKIDELGLRERTIVVFLTDNGPNGDRYNGGMKGRKGSVHEGGVRAPLFVRWPGTIDAGQRIDRIAAHVDLFPTLVELCGISMPETLPQDGRSLAPLLVARGTASATSGASPGTNSGSRRSSGTQWLDRVLLEFRFAGKNTQDVRGAARNQRYRAVLDRPQQGWELYDMVEDANQTHNIARQKPEVVAELRREFERVAAEIRPETLAPLPVPVGHDAAPLVELPGHEAFLFPAQGDGISYHGPNGWANDWIDYWTDATAYPYWNLDVVRGGTFEVTLMYACAESDVGSVVRVEAGDSAVEGTVKQAHDPAPLPVRDRIGRKEAPDKTWQPLVLGTIELSAGPSKLRIRALSKAGSEVLDVKAVRLARVR